MDFLDLLLQQRFTAYGLSEFLYKTTLHYEYQYDNSDKENKKHRLAPVMLKLLETDPMDSTREGYGRAYQKAMRFMNNDVREAFFKRGVPTDYIQVEFSASAELYEKDAGPGGRPRAGRVLRGSLKGDKEGKIISASQRRKVFWLAVHHKDVELQEAVLTGTPLDALASNKKEDMDKIEGMPEETQKLFMEKYLGYHYENKAPEEFSVLVTDVITTRHLGTLKKAVGDKAYNHAVNKLLQSTITAKEKMLSKGDVQYVLNEPGFTPSKALFDTAMTHGKPSTVVMFLPLVGDDIIADYQLQFIKNYGSQDVRTALSERGFVFKERLPDGRSVLAVFAEKVNDNTFSQDLLVKSFLKQFVYSGLYDEVVVLKELSSKGMLNGLLGEESFASLWPVMSTVFQSLIAQSEVSAAESLLTKEGLSSVPAPVEGFEDMVCSLDKAHKFISAEAYQLLGKWIMASGAALEWGKIWECSEFNLSRGRMTVRHEAFLWSLIVRLEMVLSADQALVFKAVILDKAVDYLLLLEGDAAAARILFEAVPVLDKLAVNEDGSKLDINEEKFRNLFITRDKFESLHDAMSMKYFVNHVLAYYSEALRKKMLKKIYSADNLWLMAYLLSPTSGFYSYIRQEAVSYFTSFAADVGEYEMKGKNVARLLLFRCVLPKVKDGFDVVNPGIRQGCETNRYTLTGQFTTTCSIEVGDCDERLITGLPEEVLDAATGK